MRPPVPDREHTRYYSTRPRRIPPEFCTDELLEGCSLLAVVTLYRIISQADDQGRLPGAPKYVRGTCFPMREGLAERKVADAIDELVRAGFLIRYDAKGRVFLQIDRWFDLQGKWGRRAYPSRFPAPPGWIHDWVSEKADEAGDERALGPQPAGELHPPITVPLPVTPTIPVTGLGRPPAGAGGLERIDVLIEKAKRGDLSQREAFELGSAAASDVLTGPRTR
jgi:hypothetical protein